MSVWSAQKYPGWAIWEKEEAAFEKQMALAALGLAGG